MSLRRSIIYFEIFFFNNSLREEHDFSKTKIFRTVIIIIITNIIIIVNLQNGNY